jgi:hypothetical protein
VKDEPGVARPLADPAVGDDVLVVRDAVCGVQVTELGSVLEGAVFLDRLGPRHGDRAWDVAGSLSRLRQAGRGQHLTPELGRAPDVDERDAPVTEARQDVVTEGPEGEVRLGELVVRRRIARNVGRRRQPAGGP